MAEPRQIGKPLRGQLAGIYSARRGTYRVLYRIQERAREVVVLRIEHRSDVYRPLTAAEPVDRGAAGPRSRPPTTDSNEGLGLVAKPLAT